jgi:hypothetical protein
VEPEDQAVSVGPEPISSIEYTLALNEVYDKAAAGPN